MKRIYRMASGYEPLRGFLEQTLADFDDDDMGQTAQSGRNLIKVFVAPDGTKLNIKRYHRPVGANKLVYSWNIRKPKGLRAFLYPSLLEACGIPTPPPVAYIEERSAFGMLGYSYFVSLQLDYGHKMYEWGDAAEGTFEDFAEAFGRFTARIHQSGMMHKDYSPGNILWRRTEGGYDFALVDINQFRFGWVGMRRGCANFARLWGQKPFFRRMARAYAEARGFDAAECERLVLDARARFWKRYARRKPEKVGFKLEI